MKAIEKLLKALRLFPKYYVGQHGPQLPHQAVMQTFAFVLSVFGLVAATCWTIISGILDVNNMVEDTSMFQRSGRFGCICRSARTVWRSHTYSPPQLCG